MPRSGPIPGLYVCECGNSIPIASMVIGTSGVTNEVIAFPADVRCGCGRPMNIWYEEDKHGELPGLHGRDHLGGTAGRDEDPAGREGTSGGRGAPLPDHGVHRPAQDRGGERERAEGGDGGSPRDLPPAARHLAIGETYLLRGGEHAEHVGELKHVEVTDFGFVFGTLDVWTDDGIVEGVRLNADHLEARETPFG